MGIEDFKGVTNADDYAVQRTLAKCLRSVPWTLRCTFRQNEVAMTNTVEIRRMTPTVAPDGVVGTWTPGALPAANISDSCPFAACRDVTFDATFGLTMVSGRVVSGARILVRVLALSEDEESASLDKGGRGFRVQRRVSCAFETSAADSRRSTYMIKTAGTESEVRWLLTAAPDDAFLVTAQMRKGAGDDECVFNAVSYARAPLEVFSWYHAVMSAQMRRLDKEISLQATPLKRLRQVCDSIEKAPDDDPAPNLKTRRRLAF